MSVKICCDVRDCKNETPYTSQVGWTQVSRARKQEKNEIYLPDQAVICPSCSEIRLAGIRFDGRHTLDSDLALGA